MTDGITMLSLHCDECKEETVDWLANQLARSTHKEIVQILIGQANTEEEGIWLITELLQRLGVSDDFDDGLSPDHATGPHFIPA